MKLNCNRILLCTSGHPHVDGNYGRLPRLPCALPQDERMCQVSTSRNPSKNHLQSLDDQCETSDSNMWGEAHICTSAVNNRHVFLIAFEVKSNLTYEE